MIEIRGIFPLLAVFDMPTSLAFYCDTLGFKVTASDGPAPSCDWVTLTLNGSELMLNTAFDSSRRPPAPDPASIAAHRDTSLYLACPDVDGAYLHLKAHGLTLEPPKVAWYGMKQIYFTDPDNYLLCLQWPDRASK